MRLRQSVHDHRQEQCAIPPSFSPLAVAAHYTSACRAAKYVVLERESLGYPQVCQADCIVHEIHRVTIVAQANGSASDFP